MSRGVGGVVMRAFGARDHQTVVTAVESRAGGYVRVYFASETLFDDVTLGPTSWVRCWFPDERGREHQRAYTFVDADPAAGTFALDFLRHSPGGPALRWAEAAAPGDRLAMVSMSSVPYEIDPDDPPAGVLLIGDAASLPAIDSILAAAPTHVPIELYLHLEPAAESVPEPQAHPRLRVHRVQGTGPDSLAAALEERDWSGWQAWAGAESAALKVVRRRLKEFGFPRAVTDVQAYWVRGRRMGKARDPESGAAIDVRETATDDRAASVGGRFPRFRTRRRTTTGRRPAGGAAPE